MTEPPPTVAPGSRIRLIAMGDDPDPIPVGAEGTVIDSALIQTLGADPYEQVTVAWDNGRSLHLVCPPDQYLVLPPALC